MFVVLITFRTIPTVESYGAGVFVPTGTDLAVKLLNGRNCRFGNFSDLVPIIIYVHVPTLYT